MPQAGEIYRHYKSTGGNDHTYEIIGIAKHSESDEVLVIYKPLYIALGTWLGDSQYAARPLSMRDQDVEYNGKIVKRFIKIS